MTTETLIAAWAAGSLVVAIISEQRGYGFFQGLIMAIVFSPILGMVGLMLHTEDYDARKKAEKAQKAQRSAPVRPDAYAMPGENIPHAGSRYNFDLTNELYKLSILRDRGVITQAEFELQKSKLFNA